MPQTYYIGDDDSPQSFDIGADLSPSETDVLLKALASGEEYEVSGTQAGEAWAAGDYEIGEEYEIEGDVVIGEEYEIEGNDESFEVGNYELGASFNPFLQASQAWGRSQALRRAPGPTNRFQPQNRALPARSLAKGPSMPYPMPYPMRRPMNTMPQRAPMGVPPMVVRKSNPDKGRVLWIGFASTAAIAAGATANVSSNPQDVFKARKLFIPASIAPAFIINDIKVGNISQFSSSDPVPAESFVADSVAGDVSFDTAQVSQQITFNVTNVSGAPVIFRASINGYVARQ